MALAETISQRWYEDRSPACWALPLAALYGGITRCRRSLYRLGVLRSERLPVPVVVVGNIVAGGVGKTPLTIALVEGLRARGFHPGVVSRGYGGAARAPMLLDEHPDPAQVGDEPALIRLDTGAPVAIARRRIEAGRLLLDQDVDVIIADDGLQHLALARDLEICVVDGVRRCGNGRLLPAGPLRESAARLHEVDFVVCNGGEPREGEVPMRLALADAVALDGTRTRPLADFAGRHVHAVAGIGNPSRFFEAMRACGIDVVAHPFPDHHRYNAAELAFGDNLPVLMTSKDAVKCRAFATSAMWVVPARAALPETFLDAVAARLSARPGSASP